MLNLQEYHNKGFTKVKFKKKSLKFVKNLRKKIKENFKKDFRGNELEDFHKSVSIDDINAKRVQIINFLNTQKNIAKDVYNSLCPFMDQLLGKDVVYQRFINLALQMPNDENRPPFHRDTPLSSIHEAVVWIPLVLRRHLSAVKKSTTSPKMKPSNTS